MISKKLKKQLTGMIILLETYGAFKRIKSRFFDFPVLYAQKNYLLITK
jgi:hypothetical protein